MNQSSPLDYLAAFAITFFAGALSAAMLAAYHWRVGSQSKDDQHQS